MFSGAYIYNRAMSCFIIICASERGGLVTTLLHSNSDEEIKKKKKTSLAILVRSLTSLHNVEFGYKHKNLKMCLYDKLSILYSG